MTMVRMFVNGQAMQGGSIHGSLTDATLIRKTSTAARYRFYSIRDEFPGLYPVDEGGVAVPGELYEMEYEKLRESLLPNEPSELELTIIELADGSGSLCMRLRSELLDADNVVDISQEGGWHAYLATKQKV